MKYNIILCFLLYSCTKKENCPYYEGINNYLKNELNTSISKIQDEHLFYLLDLQGCENCTILNTDMLMNLENNNKLTLILIGKTNNTLAQQRIEHLRNKFKILEDSTLEVYNYKTNLAKPLLLHTKNGKCYNIIEVIDPIIDEVKQYINSTKLNE